MNTWDKIKLNAAFPRTHTPYVKFFDPEIAQQITEVGQKALTNVYNELQFEKYSKADLK